MTKSFTHTRRIYVGDTDYGGVVYHSNYLNIMEEARTEWLRSLGFTLSYFSLQSIHFIVRSVNIDYVRPAMLDHLISIYCEVDHVGKTSLGFKQAAYDTDNNDHIFSKASIRLVCVNSDIKPIAIPEKIIQLIY